MSTSTRFVSILLALVLAAGVAAQNKDASSEGGAAMQEAPAKTAGDPKIEVAQLKRLLTPERKKQLDADLRS